MRRTKFILAALLATALMVVAFQAYSVNLTTKPTSTLAFAPTSGPSYPNPINQNVSVTGVMTSAIVAPACALNSPPCAISNSPLYYVNVNGWNYRLIFPASMKIPISNAHILVTGRYVTPSTYQANQWLPQMYFRGDIYVTSYYYVYPYF